MKGLHVTLRFGDASIVFGASWLAAGPLMLWALGSLFVPIMAPTFGRIETWSLAAGLTLAIGSSLLLHVIAHVLAARALDSRLPRRIPLYPFGDAAQVWPAAATHWREATIATAGPLASALTAGVAFLLWDQQLHPYLNVGGLFLAGLNAALAVINVAPGFPFDGGRLTRVIVWGLLKRPDKTESLGTWLGRLIAALLVGWGVALIAQRARFSLETGVGTLLAAGVVLLALAWQPAWKWDQPPAYFSSTPAGRLVRSCMAGLLILILLGITISLVPTNNGLEAPGIALPIEPMVDVAPDHRHPVSGSFILTTVIPQTPITAGQWAYGELSPVIKIVPPERIVPPDTTPQELARQGSRMLEESQTTAAVVGLQLAGYDAQITGQAAEVLSVLPESPAQGELQSGDWITALNGAPIRTAESLVTRIQEQDPKALVQLTVVRDGEELELQLPLMQPPGTDEPPRLGITVQTAGFDAELPFPVRITPEKISGGPSAGLMFTLSVYNLVTPEDVTGGRKIAGTGTINAEGEVGPIGGVELKVASAERAGAEYFLVPPENYEDARRVAQRIKVVQVATAQEAVKFLRESVGAANN